MFSTLSATMPNVVAYRLYKIFSFLGMFLLRKALHITYTSLAFCIQIRCVLINYT